MEGYKGKGNGLNFQCRVKRPGHSEERYISNTKSNALETTAMSVVCGGHFALRHHGVTTTNIFHANLSVGHGHLVQETTKYENTAGEAFIF